MADQQIINFIAFGNKECGGTVLRHLLNNSFMREDLDTTITDVFRKDIPGSNAVLFCPEEFGGHVGRTLNDVVYAAEDESVTKPDKLFWIADPKYQPQLFLIFINDDDEGDVGAALVPLLKKIITFFFSEPKIVAVICSEKQEWKSGQAVSPALSSLRQHSQQHQLVISATYFVHLHLNKNYEEKKRISQICRCRKCREESED